MRNKLQHFHIYPKVTSVACLSFFETSISFAAAKKNEDDWEVYCVYQGTIEEQLADKKSYLRRLIKTSQSPAHRNLLLLPTNQYRLLKLQLEHNSEEELVAELVTLTEQNAESFVYQKIIPANAQPNEWIVSVVSKDIIEEQLKLAQQIKLPCHQITILEMAIAGMQPYLPSGILLFLIQTNLPGNYQAMFYYNAEIKMSFDLPTTAESDFSEIVSILLEMFRQQLEDSDSDEFTLVVMADKEQLANDMYAEIQKMDLKCRIINGCALPTLPQKNLAQARADVYFPVAGVGYYAATFT